MSDATYASERAKYEALRQEIAEESVPIKPLPNFNRLIENWRTAEPAAQRRSLNQLFEALFVEDGEIVRYRPRAEHRYEVKAIIDAATYGKGFRWQAPTTGRGSNLTKKARLERRRSKLEVDDKRGKGGIRTLEGALHPL